MVERRVVWRSRLAHTHTRMIVLRILGPRAPCGYRVLVVIMNVADMRMKTKDNGNDLPTFCGRASLRLSHSDGAQQERGVAGTLGC